MDKRDQIEEVLEKKIRPSLERHQGDVKFASMKEGVVSVKLLGQCSHCPSAKYTVEEFVKTEIMEQVEGIKDVVLFEEVSLELMDMARSILSKKVK